MTQRVFAYNSKTGNLSLCLPAEGARLIARVVITAPDGSTASQVFDPAIASDRLNNGIALLESAGHTVEMFPGELDDSFIARVLTREVEVGRLDKVENAVEIDFNALPDRKWREAWVLQNGTVIVDLEKARGVAQARADTAALREYRDGNITFDDLQSRRKSNATACAAAQTLDALPG